MPKIPENPVNGTLARQLLGLPGPPLSETRFSAIKKAMRIRYQRYVLVSEMRTWIAAHPEFRVADSYPRAGAGKGSGNTSPDRLIGAGHKPD